jgi:hypothetical protein
MGIRFHKSINMGPLRINLSKSGIGYSVGTKGFRVTKKANGGTRTTIGIPGSGISYINDTTANSTKKSGCLSFILILPFKLCWWMFYLPFWLMFLSVRAVVKLIRYIIIRMKTKTV